MKKQLVVISADRPGLVTKANSLIEASYTLTLNEQRIILACAAKLDGRKPLPRETEFVLTATEFCAMFGTDPGSSYGELRDAANRLFERDIRRIEGNGRARIRWVFKAYYEDGTGLVKLSFSPEIAPYLCMLHEQFTSYPLEEIAALRTAYAIRLFEMLSQYASTGLFVIGLDEFKSRLELTEKYPRFANFKARVILPAVGELNAKTNLDVTWSTIKNGKAVERLEFRFVQKAQHSLPL